ncbi:MAG: polyphosphate polymerase domain-containing protein [Lachnospiraceae bacterium]|nr:polyphosphate polymerase domain-containing protein [Lachnospiraceae bacterium]
MFEDIKKFRHEHKYIEPEINLVGMQQRLGALMKKDPHVSEKGYYSIRSLYFDDYRDRFLNENIDGVDERSKWRIRIYDRSADRISLERKIRKSDLISKQSCVIDICTYEKLLDKTAKIDEDNPPLLNLFIKEIRTSGLHPAVIVEYERTPFVHSSGNTRVTIDRNIRSSSETDAFLEDRQLNARPVLPKGYNLIEVKYDAFLPDQIAHATEHGRMRRETFSKYYLARKFPYNGIPHRQIN